jgi:hypothetical protein
MKLKSILLILCVVCLTGGGIIYFLESGEKKSTKTESKNEKRARFHWQRVKYDVDLMKDPATGKIPRGIFELERAQALAIPLKENISNALARTTQLNTYFPAGPNNIGGRTRALAYDVRYNGSSNRVILAGSVSGGIMRSADGGNSWTRVSPENDIHNISAIAQDPRSGSQDIWYAGSGESLGNSANIIGAPYYGQYVWKSINNGVTWTRVSLNITDIPGNGSSANLEEFDHPFDFVHQVAVNPSNGHVYIAGHRRVMRTTDGGNSFSTVFGSTVPANSSNGQSDIVITNSGKIILAVNGGNPDQSLRGVWTSASGNLGSYTRIAGGTTAGADLVTGWRGNSTDDESRRIVLGLAPSNQNIVYILYENGLSSDPPDSKPEADLFKLNMSGGTNTWTNLSINVPDYSAANLSGSDPFTVQGGYDMMVKVKPDNENFVILGGTNLYRSTNGFSTSINDNPSGTWINGYATNFTYALYPNGHPDMHNLAFNPANPNEAISANDGGLQKTTNISAATVTWTMTPNYQTLQYYHIAMDPGIDRNNFSGGSQDNGTHYRDKTGTLQPAADSNNHFRIIGGDGGAQGISMLSQTTTNQYLYGSSQYGNIVRTRLTNGITSTSIRPNNLTPSFDDATNEFGEFVTNFRLNPDNTEDLYYVNFNRLFRTTAASTVSAGGWVELTGVSNTIDPSNGTTIAIRALAFSRGPYTSSHILYIGTTNGRIYRLDDPRNVAASTSPINITPPGVNGNVQDIAVNPNNDDEVMAVVSNYGVISVWWTNNAKSANPTWKNAEGNLTLPSFRSCMIVVKKDASNNPITEYYVGTSVGLYSVANLGTTLIANQSPVWVREGGNVLNFAVIQSLAYRPLDNVMLIGTHGNGMYYANIGSPNFTPNLNTGINDPVLNDRNFIRSVYPTISADQVNYQIGNMFAVKKLSVQIINLSGQVVWKKETGYQNGMADISRFSRGAYILIINSDDNKYRHLQKIVKK